MSAQPDIALALPSPPSANRLWRRASGKPRERTPEYSAWLRDAGWEARRQLVGVPTITGCFRAEIQIPEKSRRDSDNWSKPLFDLCQHIGAVRNDSGLRGYRVDPVDRSDVLVALWAVPGPEQRQPPPLRLSRRKRSVRPTQAALAAWRRGTA
jgi:Holliday junction resolvase RusA-like endonuclease